MDRVGQPQLMPFNRPLDSGLSYDPLPSESPISNTISAAWGFVRRQWWVALSILPIMLGFALFYLHITPEGFTAIAKIMVDTEQRIHIEDLRNRQPPLGDDPISVAIIDSQIEIMKSQKFALSIVRKLNLMQFPEFNEPNWIQKLWGKVGFSIPNSKTAIEQRTLVRFEKKLNVTRLPMTHVIDIAFQSPDPDRAAEIANTIADTFIHDNMDVKFTNLGKATKWLDDRLSTLRAQASAADHAVVDYKKKHNIVAADGRLMTEQQLGELNTALVQARATTVEAKAKLDQVAPLLTMNTDEIDPATSKVAAVADVLRSPVITGLRARYLDMQEKELTFAAKYGQNHGSVINLKNTMREIRRGILQEFQRIAESYKNDYDVAKEREASLQASIDKTIGTSQITGNAQVDLRQLESAAQSYRTLYDNFQARYNEFAAQQSFPVSESQITDALPPVMSSSPKSAKILGMAIAAGLVFGLALAFLREIMDRVFRTGDQVEARIKTRCIAILPLIEATREPKGFRRVQRLLLPFIAKTKVVIPDRTISLPKGHLMHHVIEAPFTPFAEAIRSIKLAADHSKKENTGRDKIFGLTSSLPGEGKSTVSASLAQLCAHSGARVILVDCDLRRRSLTQALASDAKRGIIDVVNGTARFEEVTWRDPQTGLTFLPAVANHLPHTSEILACPAMQELFNCLSQDFDYVIVDLSPLVPIVDVRAAIHLVDACFFVVEWGKTRIDIVERALKASPDVYENLLGAVLNKVHLPHIGRYDHSGYYGAYVRHGQSY